MIKIISVVLLLAGLISCASTQQKREISSAERTKEIYGISVPLHNAEVVPDSEGPAIGRLNDIMTTLFKNVYGVGADGKVSKGTDDPGTHVHFKGTRRGVHPRSHGCVEGSLKVDDNIKVPTGIFQPGREYNVTIRLSNGSPKITGNDKDTDTRGFGMKVHNVEGQRIISEDFNPGQPYSQDFTLNSSEPFFSDNAKHYSEFMQILNESKDLESAGLPFILKVGAEDMHPIVAKRILGAFKAIQNLKVTNPLGISYYSITPFQHGPGADAPIVKYKVEPCQGEWQESTEPNDKFFLRTNLVKHLAKKDACFKFMIQNRIGNATVEDGTLAWDQKESPYYEIARVHIPSQQLMDEQTCERLVINPWNGIAEHKPVGGINRIRLPTYLLSVQRRKQSNGY